ncbi:hypothetical protein MNBD_NITROSPINAE05-875 [hydrothermal vent metagenome]|uniref:DUF4124 domain-containing protein n=1 Tax=hydrothermal vent metagenome TaxID=652676 RepID=A0A3B1D219_9ZZZZ
MSQKSRSYAGLFQGVVILGTLLFFISPVFSGVASIYKWKDKHGKVHFTDDPLKIPLHHRLDPNLEKIRALPSKKSSSRIPENKASADNTAEGQKEKDQKADDDADKKKAELAAMRDALSFLKSDVQRYKKYQDYLPAVHHARALKSDIVAALPAKKALAEKLGEYDSALLKNVKSFLKKSIQLDNIAKDLWPRRRGFVVERIRINGEHSEKDSLIKKLHAKLDKAPGKAPQKPEPENTPAPAKDREQGALNKARKYGSY